MQFTTALITLLLSASASTLATPLPDSPPPPPPTWTPPAMNLTTISITALSPGNPIDNTYLSAHRTGLWLNYTADDSDASCALANGVATVPARPWAVFLHDNDTTTLSLYNGPNDDTSSTSGSWQTVYDDRSAGLLRYRGLPNEAPPTDATWPDAVSGWTQSTPTVGGNVELLWKGGRLWACDVGDEVWRVSTQEWKVFPMGTRGCVQFIARIVREGGEEPALECVYSPDV